MILMVIMHRKSEKGIHASIQLPWYWMKISIDRSKLNGSIFADITPIEILFGIQS